MLQYFDWRLCRRPGTNPTYLADLAEVAKYLRDRKHARITTTKLRDRLIIPSCYGKLIESVTNRTGKLVIEDWGNPWVTPRGVYWLFSAVPLREGSPFYSSIYSGKLHIHNVCTKVIQRVKDNYARYVSKADYFDAKRKDLAKPSRGDEDDALKLEEAEVVTADTILKELAAYIQLDEAGSLLGLKHSILKYQWENARDIFHLPAANGVLTPEQLAGLFVSCPRFNPVVDKLFHVAAMKELEDILKPAKDDQNFPRYAEPEMFMPVESDLSFLD